MSKGEGLASSSNAFSIITIMWTHVHHTLYTCMAFKHIHIVRANKYSDSIWKCAIMFPSTHIYTAYINSQPIPFDPSVSKTFPSTAIRSYKNHVRQFRGTLSLLVKNGKTEWGLTRRGKGKWEKRKRKKEKNAHIQARKRERPLRVRCRMAGL